MRIFLVILLTTLTSCGSDPELDKHFDFDEPFYLKDADMGSSPELIDVNTLKHQKLTRWIQENNSGWNQPPVSYLGEFLITQDSTQLLFNDKLVVLILNNGDKTVQYSKAIGKGELYFLIEY